jgi:putative tricarboxylic transport membrane protein
MPLESLTGGLALFFNLNAIAMTAAGCFLGLVIGVLPGLGPLMGIVLMTPVAFYLPPVAGMGLLIAIFVGGSCGGAISAILLRIPGTPLAAATLLDGHPMHLKGRSAEAIGLAIGASSLGGLIGGLFLIFCSPLLADFALEFAPPEYFALTLTGLITIAVVSYESTVKGLLVGLVGLLTATIGMDEFSSVYRFTFGFDQLLGGFHIVAMVVGLFALSEMFMQIEAGGLDRAPQLQRVRASLKAGFGVAMHPLNLVRSSVIGTFFGALPGAGGVISAFTSYAVAKSVSRHPERFGTGIGDGVVATEAANNACCGGTLIPTLALGVPGDASSAVLMGALILLGFFPGPELFENHLDVVGGIFLAYVSANVFLFILGVAFTPIFAAVLKIKKKFLIPIVLLLSTIGTYSLQASIFDLWVMLGFGVIGYGLRRFDYPLAPLVIGAVLGPICESNFRRSLVISANHYGIFVQRPLSATILALDLLLLIWVCLPSRLKQGLKGGGEA